MNGVDFLTLDDVLEIHRDQIEHYGGSPEIRDAGLLQSAIAMPQATYEDNFLHDNIHRMAAAYLFHITQSHPFVDGNKRTGAVAAIVFLELNGFEMNAPEDEFEKFVCQVASGKANKEAIAEFFLQNT
jgi:death-on-curing protein